MVSESLHQSIRALYRAEVQRLHNTLEHNQQTQRQLEEYVRELEQEIERLLSVIAELTRL